jgi:cell wall-associated NlpC family hydrolase
VINLAKTMLDIPYRFGGTTLRGIDCSAYVQRVFSMLDIAIPRTAREQFSIGAQIGREELSVGDLVFFRTYASFPSHVGIYIGDAHFIHASSVVRKVTIDSLEQGYYRKRFLGGRRLVTDAAQAVASAP